MLRRFTDVLIEEGIMDAQRLGELIAARTDLQEPVDEYLVRVGAIDERTRARVLSLMYGVPLLDFQTVTVQPEALALVPREVALRCKAVPIGVQGSQLVVAMADPADIVALDDLRTASGREIAIAVAPRPQIQDALMRYYGLDEDVKTVVQRMRAAEEEDTSVIRLVEAVLNRAIADRASDLHIEPMEGNTRVRERIDGVLRQTAEIPRELHEAVVARIKIMSNLDIAEKRAPQDGRIAYRIGGQDYDLRVSTYPSVHGEKVVLRILEKSTERFDLQKLGLEESVLTLLKRIIERPYGMLIVCGPTGSGKTTTLYASLSHLNTPERNIITIEDPVEYQLPGITQANVNPRAGLTFATGLRAILRQDPDVVLVGEIRDRETAVIAVEAALTGHMVFSTLHANEAAGAPGRLIEMGVEPFLLASALVGVLSQRLVRLLCKECREPTEPDPELLARLRLTPQMVQGHKLYAGRGCHRCQFTGYRGRRAIVELMEVNDTIRHHITHHQPTTVIRESAIQNGMVPLYRDALRLVLTGETSLEEVLRVVANDVDEAPESPAYSAEVA
ncbi:MAG: GspE/PulE family protein [Armatimonadetes bacterium]|nr:GspE/PulE family protein [Armatimonadota bacterium]CUU37244.1 type II secretion system protein E (GspE) [Armatimonadetes bacterium DC]